MTLPESLRDWPDDAVEAYRERVAIMVVDGEMPEKEARVLAQVRVRMEWARRKEQRRG
jgi:hypothetical protein